MVKKSNFLRFFTHQYWVNRCRTVDKWKGRKTSIKYLFRDGLKIQHTEVPPNRAKDFNEVFKDYKN